MRRIFTTLLASLPLLSACSGSAAVNCPDVVLSPGGSVAHPVGASWTDGCMSCSCDNLGGTPSVVCTHNTCPPDASTDDRDGSGGDATADANLVLDAHPSIDSAQCRSLLAAYQTAYSSATECSVDAGGQCATMIDQPFACRCASFVNGSSDGVNAAAADWTKSACTDLCTGSCGLATHAECVADSTSPMGGRCADRDVAAGPP